MARNDSTLEAARERAAEQRSKEEARRQAELTFIALYKASHDGRSPSRHEITAFLQDTRR